MAKTPEMLLGERAAIPILYEDRSVLAIDKPPGWMLAPISWDRTGRNLQRAIELSLQARDFWARSRNLKFLRFAHRLDADTSGVLLLAKSPGALTALQQAFETRQVEKFYLAVVQGVPNKSAWDCQLALAPGSPGGVEQKTVRDNHPAAKPAATKFRVLQTREDRALVLAQPLTGRTHQIRVHLAAAGHPVFGDTLYGQKPSTTKDHHRPLSKPEPNTTPKTWPLALRALALSYPDPFTGKLVRIEASGNEFARAFGFKGMDKLW
jgi:23S rRNA pseudouridine1911/1915/1917 synthase